jgi:hypothetical protein
MENTIQLDGLFCSYSKYYLGALLIFILDPDLLNSELPDPVQSSLYFFGRITGSGKKKRKKSKNGNS